MSAPSVELHFNPTDLRPRDLPRAGAYLGSPADALEAALAMARVAMINQMRAEVRGIAEPTSAQMVRIADLAWQALFWRYRKVSAPVMADAYVRAYKAANAGDVPMSVIYDLADKHAEKIGDYFQATSRDALAEGFNTMVNRRIPAKAAADRVLDAYGLTPRQMRGFTSNKQFAVPVDSVMPLQVRARARQYIDRSFTQRTRKLARQEEHNIDEQAKQFAWMWLQDKGRLSEKAEKLWITAKDERVCPVCGPLHGQKVRVGEQFHTAEGKFWTPGLHPNCRCVVRLIENTFTKMDWDPKEHPRGGDPENRGRFSRVAERDRPVINVAEQDVIETTQEPTYTVSLGRQLDLSSRRTDYAADLSAPPSVDLSAPQLDLSQKVDLSSKVDLTDYALPKVSVAPVVSDVTIVRDKPKKQKMVPYEEIRPLDETYYRVVSGDPSFHQFDKDVFSSDRDQVIMDAAQVREAAISRIMEQHVVGGQVKYSERLDNFGVPMQARMTATAFRHVLESAAQGTTSEYPVDALIDVDYYDPDGQEDDAPLASSGRTVLDILHAVGVDPDHLVVNVLKLDAVHSENVGRGTAHRVLVAGHSFDEYEITGEYSVQDFAPEYEHTGTPVGMDIYYVEPHDPAIGYMAAPD